MASPATSLHGVLALGRADALVVGDATLLLYNGDDWIIPAGIPKLDGVTLGGVWGTSDADLFIATKNSPDGDILHYDGSAWSTTAAGSASEGMNAVFGVTDHDVYAVGLRFGFVTTGVARHFDGATWATTDVGPPGGQLLGVWASADRAIAVGSIPGPGTPPSSIGAAFRSDAGGVWMTEMLPSGTPVLTGVWGSSDQDIYAVGRSSSGLVPTIVHYDGMTWTTLGVCPGSPCFDPLTSTSVPLSGISGTGANNIFAAGDSGAIVHYDGTQWSVVPMTATPPPTPLVGVSALASPAEAFAVGVNGAIWRNTGE
jgi:hypothetical protein